MKYAKGQSGNPDGRKKGAPNKITGTLRDMMNDFLNDNYENFLNDYRSLPVNERVKTYRHCLQFCLPKLNSVDIQSDKEPINELIITTCRNKLIDRLINKKTENENETV